MTTIIESTETIRHKVIHHPMYEKIRTVADLRVFMEFHVVAVWDFMSLLKALQLQFTSVTVPWIPTQNAAIRRMINEIVLAEESDIFAGYPSMSHFEFYILAMQEAGADTQPILQFIDQLNKGTPLDHALAASALPTEAKRFVTGTFELLDRHCGPDIAAVFAYTREGLIPAMFSQIVAHLRAQFPDQLRKFSAYLQHHIELDGDTHGPLADQMVQQLCGDDLAKRASATQAVESAFQSRIALWDGVHARLTKG